MTTKPAWLYGNPTVTLRLTHREFVLFVANHSRHFTTSAGERIAGELADGCGYGYSARRKITCNASGHHAPGTPRVCIAEYDSDGFYYVTTTAYASASDAWADTVTIPGEAT
jgi:hypothetical protein